MKYITGLPVTVKALEDSDAPCPKCGSATTAAEITIGTPAGEIVHRGPGLHCGQNGHTYTY